MIDSRRGRSFTTLLLSSALLVAACGGSTAATQAPVPETPATPVAAATPTPEATPVAEATPTTVLPSFDLTGLTNNLDNVDSYRISISMAGSTVYQATVVTKPEKAEEISLGEGTDVTKVLRIGTDVWMSTGGEPYVKDTLGMANTLIGTMSPLLLLGAFAKGNIAAVSTDLGTEQKNGVNTHHYRFDASSAATAGFTMPAGAGLDFWVADDGYLAAYEFTGAAAEQSISINVSNVDDPANKVERPN